VRAEDREEMDRNLSGNFSPDESPEAIGTSSSFDYAGTSTENSAGECRSDDIDLSPLGSISKMYKWMRKNNLSASGEGIVVFCAGKAEVV